MPSVVVAPAAKAVYSKRKGHFVGRLKMNATFPKLARDLPGSVLRIRSSKMVFPVQTTRRIVISVNALLTMISAGYFGVVMPRRVLINVINIIIREATSSDIAGRREKGNIELVNYRTQNAVSYGACLRTGDLLLA